MLTSILFFERIKLKNKVDYGNDYDKINLKWDKFDPKKMMRRVFNASKVCARTI